MGYFDGLSLYRAYFAPAGLDPFGLKLAILEKKYYTELPLEILYAEGDYGLGNVDINFAGKYPWDYDGNWETEISEFDVDSSVCPDCKAYFISCTVKRKVMATARINITPVRPSKEYPEDVFGDLISQLNAQVEWEEAAHLASVKRWFKPHQQTAYAWGCNKLGTETSACIRAEGLVKLYEAAVWAAYAFENEMIDTTLVMCGKTPS